MAYSQAEQAAKNSRPQGFGTKKGQSPSPSPPGSSSPPPSPQEGEPSAVPDPAGLISPEVLLQQGLEAGRSAASVFMAGVFHGIAAELALNPNQVWQAALRLLPPQHPLTLEQQQQQNRHILANALQKQYGESLNRLPAGTGSLGLLPAAELPETHEIYGVRVGIPVPTIHEIDLSEVNLDPPDLSPAPAESPDP